MVCAGHARRGENPCTGERMRHRRGNVGTDMEPSYQEELIHASLCYTPAVYDKYLGVIFTLKPWPVLKQRPLVSGAEIFHEDRYAVASAG